MDPIILFIATGFLAMSTALSAGALNKLPEDKRSGFMATRNGALFVVMMGNIAALTLIGALAYGFSNLHWAIPLSCVFVSFPLFHILILQRLLGEKRSILLTSVPTLASAVMLYIYW